MELGIVQTKWIESLIVHPERQLQNQLGKKINDTEYKACCLGELLLCYNKENNIESEWRNNQLIDVYGKENEFTSTEWLGNHTLLGLHNSTGFLPVSVTIRNKTYDSLAAMNDDGITWPEIAEYVKANPDNVFTKSF